MAKTQATGREIRDASVEKIDLADPVSSAIYEVSEAGWQEVIPGETVIVESCKLVVCTKFVKHSGFIKHSGYISRTI